MDTIQWGKAEQQQVRSDQFVGKGRRKIAGWDILSLLFDELGGRTVKGGNITRIYHLSRKEIWVKEMRAEISLFRATSQTFRQNGDKHTFKAIQN